jgi:hypothetical protein
VKSARSLIYLLLGAVLSLSVPAAVRGQEEGDVPPKPAARSHVLLGEENQQDQVTDQDVTTVRPDYRPLTGIQDLTIGSPELLHSYWMPGASYFNALQSNGYSQGGGASWDSTNFLVGNFSTNAARGSGQNHQLGVVQEFNWARLHLSFLDQLSYLPSSSFGFGAGTNLSFPGVSGSPGAVMPGLGSGGVPNQSIYTGVGPRYSNAFGSQMTYELTPRSSFTLGGVYGILRFTDSASVESNDLILNAGYNYALSQKDTVGLSYRFTTYHFLGQPQAIGNNSPRFSYGRTITGKLALQLSGGVEVSSFRVPINGETQHIGGAGSAHLQYQVERGSFHLSYNHGVSGGSGVFVGATTDQIQVGGDRHLTRQWTGNAHFGYAHNRQVIQTDTAAGSATYNSLYFGAGAARPLGNNMSFSSSYTGYVQHSSAGAACVIGTCGQTYTTHQITLGFNWHTRPFVLP